jgi:fatty-acyl-CoA synthase
VVTDTDTLYGCSSEPALLLRALDTHADKVAIFDERGKMTYRQLHEEISRYCQAFASLGIKQGDRVGLLSGNRPEVIFVNSALSILGCVLVPMHPKGSLRDHAYMVRDSGLRTLVFDVDAYGERARELRNHSQVELIGFGTMSETSDLVRLAARFAPGPLLPPLAAPNDMCRLSYSGGTTGEPKAIIGTYLSLLTKITIQMVDWEWPDEIRQLICTPLSHGGGAMVLPTLIRGGSLFILPTFSASGVMQAIETHRITCMMLVPTMISTLLDLPNFDSYDIRSLQTIYYGAASISPTRLRQAIQAFGPILFQFYGQTESPMTVCVMRMSEHRVDDLERLASCGRPVPWVRVQLLDDDGRPVEDGQPGEICVRGPLVMVGYWNKPEQTREALKDNWLHTGDMAVRSTDGFLRIVDRKKDMIISGGFNVFAREVEEAICEHPSVAACAVFGIPDAHWGEAVAAAVVLKPGLKATTEEIAATVREIKGPVQTPKKVEFLVEIPLTSLGKPDKKALRARYAAPLGG